jgi:hypothetical protein
LKITKSLAKIKTNPNPGDRQGDPLRGPGFGLYSPLITALKSLAKGGNQGSYFCEKNIAKVFHIN